MIRFYFKSSIIVSVLGLGLALAWGGWLAMLLALMLSLLEIGLSFDNAVLNAATLKKMTPLWQARFLSWGIIIAVFVVRLWLPVFIIALQSSHTMREVLILAIKTPLLYREQLQLLKPGLFSFGGIFLMLIFLDFLYHPPTAQRWLKQLDNRLAQAGKHHPWAMLIASLFLMLRYYVMPEASQASVLTSGLVAMLTFLILKKCSSYAGSNLLQSSRYQILPFLYLEILDASFSLDGVIGAFALSEDLVIIFIGLIIGAIFVRSFTVYLSQHTLLERYPYLEHGAHYAVGILASVLLLDPWLHVPSVITGLLGIGVIGLAVRASYTASGI